MSLSWNEYSFLRNAREIESRLMEDLSDTNYGDKPGNWNLTDIILRNDSISHRAANYLTGRDSRGEQINNGLPTTQLSFSLKVLSRQACYKDEDGKYINGFDWRATKDNGLGEENVIYPGPTDKPEPGDIVRVKGDYIARYGAGTRGKREREAAKMLKENEEGRTVKPDEINYRWNEYVVDKDGYIDVPVFDAFQLLYNYGKRTNVPKFRYVNTTQKLDGERVSARKIVNWRFEEHTKKKNKPGRPSKKVD